MRKRKCRIRTAAILGVIGILLGLSLPVFAGGEELTPEMEMWLNGDSIQSGIVFDSDYGWTPGKDNAYYGSSLENGVMDEVVYEEHSVPFRNGQVGSFTYQNFYQMPVLMIGDLEFESRHGENQEEYPGLTETENRNDVAVDPRLIPLGSLLIPRWPNEGGLRCLF